MREITKMQAQWKGSVAAGNSLSFSQCKGGYFSTDEEYALKVMGKTVQNGTPTPEVPIDIRCVKAGTTIKCGTQEILTPCDLYEGDVWYPMSGKVIKVNAVTDLHLCNWQLYKMLREGVYCYYTSLGDAKLKASESSYCTHFENVDQVWGEGNVGEFSDHNGSLNNKYFVYNSTTPQAFAQWLDDQYSRGTPVTLVYKLAEPFIEQYPPQRMYARSGTVTVTQEAAQEKAELSAMMLVKR